MKKLSLKSLNLETKDLLQKNQLKAVFGGYGGGWEGPGNYQCCWNNNSSCSECFYYASEATCPNHDSYLRKCG